MTDRSPSGSCHLRLLEGLHDEFDFTVFSSEFDNPAPERITWVRVPAIRRPLVARYLSFFTAGAVVQRRSRGRFDLVQTVEGYVPGADISYVHFCHRGFLGRPTEGDVAPQGLRGRVRRLDHRLRALDEGRALRRARHVVVPADHLAVELDEEHGISRRSTVVVPNPVDVVGHARPASFDRAAHREELGLAPDAVVVAFVALGHFERKGLPCVLDALAASASSRVHLLVVGGQPDALRTYRHRVAALGLADRVSFVGRQPDVRPFLWSSDAFIAPSSYEVFSLAPLQAAAAGLPLLVTDVAGVAPYFVHGRHGLSITRAPGDIADALQRFESLPRADRAAMGEQARIAAADYDVDSFVARWRAVYESVLPRTD